MKQILSVRSNAYYNQEQNEKEFALKPYLELVIIYTDGKEYKMTPSELKASPKITETRLIVSPELLQSLITDLQLHQKTLEGIRQNADKINALIKHISEA
jgi:hypothetical protein